MSKQVGQAICLQCGLPTRDHSPLGVCPGRKFDEKTRNIIGRTVANLQELLRAGVRRTAAWKPTHPKRCTVGTMLVTDIVDETNTPYRVTLDVSGVESFARELIRNGDNDQLMFVSIRVTPGTPTPCDDDTTAILRAAKS